MCKGVSVDLKHVRIAGEGVLREGEGTGLPTVEEEKRVLGFCLLTCYPQGSCFLSASLDKLIINEKNHHSHKSTVY